MPRLAGQIDLAKSEAILDAAGELRESRLLERAKTPEAAPPKAS